MRLSQLPLEVQVQRSGRSWWQVKMLGGRIWSEWETADQTDIRLPLLALQERTRWDELDHSKLVAARLLCPNGEIGELVATGPYKLFQLKGGFAEVGGRHYAGQLLGCVTGINGECQGHWWDGSRLRSFEDNVLDMKHPLVYPTKLSLEALDLRL